MGITQQDEIVGKEGVALSVVLEIGNTALAITADGDWEPKRPSVLAARAFQARPDGLLKRAHQSTLDNIALHQSPMP